MARDGSLNILFFSKIRVLLELIVGYGGFVFVKLHLLVIPISRWCGEKRSCGVGGPRCRILGQLGSTRKSTQPFDHIIAKVSKSQQIPWYSIKLLTNYCSKLIEL